MNTDLFLGETFAFWAELKKRADTLDIRDLVRDLADLRSRNLSLERDNGRLKQELASAKLELENERIEMNEC